MRILVAGALGEVGRTVSAALADAGHDVVKVSSRAYDLGEPDLLGFTEALYLLRLSRRQGGHPPVGPVFGGFSGQVRQLTPTPVDAVLNCAGRGDRRAGERTGRDATDALADAVQAAGIPSVLISTTRVLEGYDTDHTEDAEPRTRTPYAAANAGNEETWLDRAGTQAHVLRITNYFAAPSTGDSPQAQLLPWSLVTEALDTGHIGVRSGASLAKEFVGAADVAGAVVRVLQSNDAPQIVATIPGATLTMADLVTATQRAFVASGRPEPTASFGPDAPTTAPTIRPGWLAAHGWHGALTGDQVTDVITNWLRARA